MFKEWLKLFGIFTVIVSWWVLVTSLVVSTDVKIQMAGVILAVAGTTTLVVLLRHFL